MNERKSMFLEQPANAFCLLAVIWGGLFAFVTPPFQVADENRHFLRAYQIAEGKIIGENNEGKSGGFLPENVVKCAQSTRHLCFRQERKHRVEDTLALFDLPIESDRRVFKAFGQVVYSPVPYLPASLVMVAGNTLKLPPIMTMYLGRILNLACWVILICLAIKITPILKWVFFLLALTPMSLYQGSSLSADCLTNAFGFLTIALFLRCAFGNDEIVRKSDLYLLFVLTVCLSLSKNVYLLMVLLYLLIPRKKIGPSKKYWGIFSFLLLANITAISGWMFCLRSLASLSSFNVSPNEQFSFVVSHPVQVAFIMVKSLFIQIPWLFMQFIGRFGWMDAPLPCWHGGLWGLLLIFVSLIETNGKVTVRFCHKILSFGILSITTAGIFFALYLCFTPVGADIVKGVQGRYFMPIAPLFFLLFYNKKLHFRIKYLEILLICFTVISLANSLYVILGRFYW